MLEFEDFTWRRKREQAIQHAIASGDAYVAPSAVRAIFCEVAASDLEHRGFRFFRDRHFLREIDPDIIQIFGLGRIGALQYGLECGVSLAFVPHDWKRRIAWHRTEKAARLDLFRYPFNDDRIAEDLRDRMRIDAFEGVARLRFNMARSWQAQGPELLSWLEETRTLEQIAQRAREQCDNLPAIAGHWPPPQMVQAFCLARTGRVAEGRVLLKSVIAAHYIGLDPAENLLAAYEKVALASPAGAHSAD